MSKWAITEFLLARSTSHRLRGHTLEARIAEKSTKEEVSVLFPLSGSVSNNINPASETIPQTMPGSSAQQSLAVSSTNWNPTINGAPVKGYTFPWMKPAGNQPIPQPSSSACSDSKTRFTLTPNKKEREAAATAMFRPMRQCAVAQAPPCSNLKSTPRNTSKTSRSTSSSPFNPSKVVKPTARAPRPHPGMSRHRSSPSKFTRANLNAACKSREPPQEGPSVPEQVSRLQQQKFRSLTDEQVLTVTQYLSPGARSNSVALANSENGDQLPAQHVDSDTGRGARHGSR